MRKEYNAWRTDYPTQDGEYLITNSSGSLGLAIWEDSDWFYSNGKVVAWMCLLVPYKDVSDVISDNNDTELLNDLDMEMREQGEQG